MSDSVDVHSVSRRPPPLLSRLLSEAGGWGARSGSIIGVPSEAVAAATHLKAVMEAWSSGRKNSVFDNAAAHFLTIVVPDLCRALSSNSDWKPGAKFM